MTSPYICVWVNYDVPDVFTAASADDIRALIGRITFKTRDWGIDDQIEQLEQLYHMHKNDLPTLRALIVSWVNVNCSFHKTFDHFEFTTARGA